MPARPIARAAGRVGACALVGLVLPLALACACAPRHGQDSVPAGSPANEPAPGQARRPYGWAAYPGHRVTGVDGASQAPDAVVIDDRGRTVRLAALWAAHNVALVFYRGHW